MESIDLAASLRTVTHLSSYFAELKTVATDIADRADAESRGYFTTQEEDETRAVLISYWKSRCALFDLILSLRCERERDEQDYPEAFVIAFAAALILVDAARFLREVAEGRPTVRRKLNEPDPQHGVPKNVFDTVQKSLLSARHGWHLYHALQYYEQNAESLAQLRSREDFRPLLDTIDRLKSRLDVSVASFADAKLRTRSDQVLRRVAFNLFGRAMYGLQKMAGSLMADKYVRLGHQPGLPDNVREVVCEQLLPGDVLVVRKEFALTNYFLPGYWPHAALYLGDRQNLHEMGLQERERVRERWDRMSTGELPSGEILESMRDGVHLRSIESPFASDSIVVLRPQLNRAHVADGIVRALAHEGKPYDFGFDFRRSDRLVCTEVVYRAYDGLGALHMPLVSRAGRPTLSGSDLIRMAIQKENFEAVLVYAPAWKSEVVQDASDIVPILERGAGS